MASAFSATDPLRPGRVTQQYLGYSSHFPEPSAPLLDDGPLVGRDDAGADAIGGGGSYNNKEAVLPGDVDGNQPIVVSPLYPDISSMGISSSPLESDQSSLVYEQSISSPSSATSAAAVGNTPRHAPAAPRDDAGHHPTTTSSTTVDPMGAAHPMDSSSYLFSPGGATTGATIPFGSNPYASPSSSTSTTPHHPSAARPAVVAPATSPTAPTGVSPPSFSISALIPNTRVLSHIDLTGKKNTSKPYAVYTLKLCVQMEDATEITHSMEKRYSAFLDVHNQLASAWPNPLPKFPPKRWIKSGIDPGTISNRQKKLQTYFQSLLRNHALLRSRLFHDVLETPEKMRALYITEPEGGGDDAIDPHGASSSSRRGGGATTSPARKPEPLPHEPDVPIPQLQAEYTHSQNYQDGEGQWIQIPTAPRAAPYPPIYYPVVLSYPHAMSFGINAVHPVEMIFSIRGRNGLQWFLCEELDRPTADKYRCQFALKNMNRIPLLLMEEQRADVKHRRGMKLWRMTYEAPPVTGAYIGASSSVPSRMMIASVEKVPGLRSNSYNIRHLPIGPKPGYAIKLAIDGRNWRSHVCRFTTKFAKGKALARTSASYLNREEEYELKVGANNDILLYLALCCCIDRLEMLS